MRHGCVPATLGFSSQRVRSEEGRASEGGSGLSAKPFQWFGSDPGAEVMDKNRRLGKPGMELNPRAVAVAWPEDDLSMSRIFCFYFHLKVLSFTFYLI